jgi:hypothetical protein
VASWLSGLLGKKDSRDTRTILAEAIAEIGDPSWVSEALRFYDSPDDFLQHVAERVEPLWVEENRAPRAGELADEIFRDVLTSRGRLDSVDWADGVIAILDTFDKLFAANGLALVSAQQRAELIARHGEVERGKAFHAMWKTLESLAGERGRLFVYYNLEGDAHGVLLMTPEAHERWKNIRFGKGHYVLP